MYHHITMVMCLAHCLHIVPRQKTSTCMSDIHCNYKAQIQCTLYMKYVHVGTLNMFCTINNKCAYVHCTCTCTCTCSSVTCEFVFVFVAFMIFSLYKHVTRLVLLYSSSRHVPELLHAVI